MRRFIAAASLLALVGTQGCATVQPQVDLPVAEREALRLETVAQQTVALQRLQEHHLRVDAMAYRLAQANAELCPKRAGLPGFSLFQTAQLQRELRGAARDVYGVGDQVSLFTVTPDTPAARAGLKPGETLLAIDGERLRQPTSGARLTSADEAERAGKQLDKAMEGSRPVRLRVAGRDGEREVVLQPETGCAYDVLLFQADDVNAAADGKRVMMTTGMSRYVQNDDELAIVLGHELAHNAMRHRDRMAASTRLARAGGLIGSVLIGVTTGVGVDLYSLAARGTKQTRLTLEREADYVGLYFAARAGYDVSGAMGFWRRFAADYPGATYTRSAHPGSPERALNISATAQEIAGKRAARLALTPTPAKLQQLERDTDRAVAAEDAPPVQAAR